MNKIVLIVLVLILVAGGIYIFMKPNANQNQQNPTNFDIQGMKVEILQQGTGNGAKVGDNIEVNYTGTLLDGTKFDSSVDPSFGHVAPFTYKLGQNRVIQGWELGLLGMKVGEKRKLTIPPELGYGATGAGNAIPPNTTLIFEIDLLKIN